MKQFCPSLSSPLAFPTFPTPYHAGYTFSRVNAEQGPSPGSRTHNRRQITSSDKRRTTIQIEAQLSSPSLHSSFWFDLTSSVLFKSLVASGTPQRLWGLETGESRSMRLPGTVGWQVCYEKSVVTVTSNGVPPLGSGEACSRGAKTASLLVYWPLLRV